MPLQTRKYYALEEMHKSHVVPLAETAAAIPRPSAVPRRRRSVHFDLGEDTFQEPYQSLQPAAPRQRRVSLQQSAAGLSSHTSSSTLSMSSGPLDFPSALFRNYSTNSIYQVDKGASMAKAKAAEYLHRRRNSESHPVRSDPRLPQTASSRRSFTPSTFEQAYTPPHSRSASSSSHRPSTPILSPSSSSTSLTSDSFMSSSTASVKLSAQVALTAALLERARLEEEMMHLQKERHRVGQKHAQDMRRLEAEVLRWKAEKVAVAEDVKALRRERLAYEKMRVAAPSR